MMMSIIIKQMFMKFSQCSLMCTYTIWRIWLINLLKFKYNVRILINHYQQTTWMLNFLALCLCVQAKATHKLRQFVLQIFIF